jgi:phosphoribosyl-dephospho-CoA transferase
MSPLHRHQLVRLSDNGWRHVLARPWDEEARVCISHWAARGLPLVVTQQAPEVVAAGEVALGLAAPLCRQRRRIPLRIDRRHVGAFNEFPRVDEFALGSAWPRLCASLASHGATARVYGSHGWQRLSRLSYVHRGSDVDLWTAVTGAEHADAVAAVLEAFDDADAPRLDGELLLPDGRAFAWREWRAWRAGRSRAILAKTVNGATLVWSRVGAATQPC